MFVIKCAYLLCSLPCFQKLHSVCITGYCAWGSANTVSASGRDGAIGSIRSQEGRKEGRSAEWYREAGRITSEKLWWNRFPEFTARLDWSSLKESSSWFSDSCCYGVALLVNKGWVFYFYYCIYYMNILWLFDFNSIVFMMGICNFYLKAEFSLLPDKNVTFHFQE